MSDSFGFMWKVWFGVIFGAWAPLDGLVGLIWGHNEDSGKDNTTEVGEHQKRMSDGWTMG